VGDFVRVSQQQPGVLLVPGDQLYNDNSGITNMGADRKYEVIARTRVHGLRTSVGIPTTIALIPGTNICVQRSPEDGLTERSEDFAYRLKYHCEDLYRNVMEPVSGAAGKIRPLVPHDSLADIDGVVGSSPYAVATAFSSFIKFGTLIYLSMNQIYEYLKIIVPLTYKEVEYPKKEAVDRQLKYGQLVRVMGKHTRSVS
jgi:hypothetical protein